MSFTKNAAVNECGDVRLTRLAENCADAFDANDIDGPLDDEAHWIWDAPCIAAERLGMGS